MVVLDKWFESHILQEGFKLCPPPFNWNCNIEKYRWTKEKNSVEWPIFCCVLAEQRLAKAKQANCSELSEVVNRLDFNLNLNVIQTRAPQ